MPFEESNSSSKYNLFFQRLFFWICTQHSLWTHIHIKTRCARALCRALFQDTAFAFCMWMHLEMWFHLSSHVFDFSSWASLTLPDSSKCGAFNRSAVSFLKNICGYFEVSTAGGREQKYLCRQQTTLTSVSVQHSKSFFKKRLFSNL